MPSGTRAYQVEELLEHTEWVRRLAISLVGCESTADDLVQETFLTALMHPPKKKGAPRGWLARVLKNLVIDRSRRRIRRSAREEKVADGLALSKEEYSPSNIQARLEMQELLARVVKDLPEPYRTTTVLYYFDDLTSEQVAKKLSISASTVRNQLSRARTKIREQMHSRYGKDWKALCIGFLLKPPGGWVAPLKASSGSSWLPIASLSAIAIFTGWIWNRNSLDSVGVDIATAVHAEIDSSSNGKVRAETENPNRDRTLSDKPEFVGNLRILVEDIEGHRLSGVACRVYAARMPMEDSNFRGPEAIQLKSFPILSSGITGADGVLHLQVPFGSELAIESQLAVVAEKDGFSKSANLLWPSGKSHEKTFNTAFQLAPGSSLQVKILDQNSNPIPDARVMPRLIDPDPSDDRFQSYYLTTDEDGNATFQSLHPFVRELKCWCPGYLSQTLSISEAQLKSEKPFVVILARGGQAEIQVRSGGEPYPGARVFLASGRKVTQTHGAKEDPGYLGETDEQGYLAVSGIDTSRGAHLIAKVGGMEKRISMIVAGGSYQIDFPKFSKVSGRATLADGSPASRALVLIVDPAKLSVSHTSTCWTKEDGTFTIPVFQSLFAIGVFHPSGTLIFDGVFSSESASVEFGEIEIPLGRELTIRLKDEAGQAVLQRGKVSIVRPPEVAVGHLGEPGLLMKYMAMGLQSVLPFSSEPGEYVFRNLPDGEFLFGIDVSGQRYQVLPIQVTSTEQTVDVVVQEGLKVSMQLMDDIGAPIHDFEIELSPSDYPWNWKKDKNPSRPDRRCQDAVSDADGRVEFAGLAPGTWHLALPGRAKTGIVLKSLEVVESGDYGKLQLQPMGSLSLDVSTRSGAAPTSRVAIIDRAGIDNVSQQPWKFEAQTDHLGIMEAVSLPPGPYQVRIFSQNSLPRFADVEVQPQSLTPYSFQLDGAGIAGNLPAGMQNGQTILLRKNSHTDHLSDELIRRMRKILRRPAFPNHGGTFRIQADGKAVSFLYATCQVGIDGQFNFQSMPDGDYWLFGTGYGYRVGGPIELQIRGAEMTYCSAGIDLNIDLQLGSGIRIVVPELVEFLTYHPKGSLHATVNAGQPEGWVPASGQASTWTRADMELLPKAEAVFEVDKDRPREYQIEFDLASGDGKHHRWSISLKTQLGKIETVTVALPQID